MNNNKLLRIYTHLSIIHLCLYNMNDNAQKNNLNKCMYICKSAYLAINICVATITATDCARLNAPCRNIKATINQVRSG